jgi:hypothetical protein
MTSPTARADWRFSFGRSAGTIAGVLGALGVPAFTHRPAGWKRACGIPAGRQGAKDAARWLAIRRWPAKAELFGRKRDDGRAESCLIGWAGLQRERRAVSPSSRMAHRDGSPRSTKT